MSDRNVTHATFTLERTFPAPPARVFGAWSDAKVKGRWFAGGSSDYELDFRPGGIERNRVTHQGKQITWESLYREIVDHERIVYTSVLAEDGTTATVSLTTIEFTPEGDGTRLVLVEAGAYLDGREQPAWREQGTSDWLDSLGSALSPTHN
jgi:uncharacterized protein YndB with AHSA1/START domain